ncbi:MAG: DUF4236 domain-containing protein [Oscillospiraceae bacterium]
MGLRFHKSINLGGGFKVNLSGSGIGYSWGVPGFRISKTATGKTRRTVSIPGTGISYVSESGSKKKTSSKSKTTEKSAAKAVKQPSAGTAKRAAETAAKKAAPVSYDALKTIHRSVDEAVDWQEIASSETPTDEMYDADFWSYCHEMAPKILAGDIDAYLQVIQDMNPYDDLLDLGGNFLFGTDRSDTMEVEFTAKSEEVMPTKRELGVQKYYNLLQDYICSVAVRTARDTFALLPVEFVKIHAVDGGKLILSVCFERSGFSKIRFSLSDPSDIVEKFPHNMDFNITRGFAEVEEI